jgi:hypothetical protein
MGFGPSIFTSLKTLYIAYQNPKETLIAPQTLPTSEPETPQITYTVTATDLPSLSLTPYKKVWVASVFGAGRVVTAATIYYRMKKNGVSVKSASLSVSANFYYTCHCFFYDVKVGDVLELALWSNKTDSNWDYKAYQIQVSRLILFDKPRLLVPCNFAALSTQPVLTLGSPVYFPQLLYPCHLDKALSGISAATFYESLYPKDTYGLFRVNYGDYSYQNGCSWVTSVSYRPYYYRNYVPTQLIMRGARVE